MATTNSSPESSRRKLTGSEHFISHADHSEVCLFVSPLLRLSPLLFPSYPRSPQPNFFSAHPPFHALNTTSFQFGSPFPVRKQVPLPKARVESTVFDTLTPRPFPPQFPPRYSTAQHHNTPSPPLPRPRLRSAPPSSSSSAPPAFPKSEIVQDLAPNPETQSP